MAATWLSTHGVGAIKDSNSSFTITADRGSALIKPTRSDQLKGWIHFTIASPPADNPALKVVAVDFSSQTASVENLAIYIANNQVFEKGDLQRGQSFTLNITSSPSVAEYQNKGIAVSVYVVFEGLSSSLKFQSVGIQV